VPATDDTDAHERVLYDVLRSPGQCRRCRPTPSPLGPFQPGVSDEAVRRKLDNCVIVVFIVLAAPILAAALFWGSWGWMVAALAVAVIEYTTVRRSQRFSARLWRSLRFGRRSSRERTAETIYAVSAVAGVVLLIVAVVTAI
jgi:hypothetical protein